MNADIFTSVAQFESFIKSTNAPSNYLKIAMTDGCNLALYKL